MSAADISFETALKKLREVELFMNVPDPVTEELARKMKMSRFNAGEKIINQGDKGSSMYVILSGCVKVHDMEFVIAEMQEGNFFGEFSMLDDEPRSLSVSAAGPTITGSISQSDFYVILSKHPEVTREMIHAILKRLRNQNQQIIHQLKQRQSELEQLVNTRTEDLKNKNETLENTLSELKQAQDQLITSEKMAAFGLMASRVSHEILNPLNFVKNFSELSKEVVHEVIKSVSEEDKRQNTELLIVYLDKINEHSKRAENIVKQLQEQTNKGTAHEFFEEKNS
jgi:CRP-like cAMP-binding protein